MCLNFYPLVSLLCSGTVHACTAAENPAGSDRVHLPDGQWSHSNHKVSGKFLRRRGLGLEGREREGGRGRGRE